MGAALPACLLAISDDRRAAIDHMVILVKPQVTLYQNVSLAIRFGFRTLILNFAYILIMIHITTVLNKNCNVKNQ